jgi:hypothetical protein
MIQAWPYTNYLGYCWVPCRDGGKRLHNQSHDIKSCDLPKKEIYQIWNDDIIMMELPNKEILMAYISWSCDFLKGTNMSKQMMSWMKREIMWHRVTTSTDPSQPGSLCLPKSAVVGTGGHRSISPCQSWPSRSSGLWTWMKLWRVQSARTILDWTSGEYSGAVTIRRSQHLVTLKILLITLWSVEWWRLNNSWGVCRLKLIKLIS